MDARDPNMFGMSSIVLWKTCLTLVTERTCGDEYLLVGNGAGTGSTDQRRRGTCGTGWLQQACTTKSGAA